MLSPSLYQDFILPQEDEILRGWDRAMIHIHSGTLPVVIDGLLSLDSLDALALALFTLTSTLTCTPSSADFAAPVFVDDSAEEEDDKLVLRNADRTGPDCGRSPCSAGLSPVWTTFQPLTSILWQVTARCWVLYGRHGPWLLAGLQSRE